MNKRLGLVVLFVISYISLSLAQSTDYLDSLKMKTVELEEVEINSALVRHDSRLDEYRLTPALTQGATSIYDVLSNLPGITYNSINNSVNVRMDKAVLIEVEGNRVSSEYIQALPIDIISKIQVIYVPNARYSTEGIRYVINVKLKKDYEGHSLYLGNTLMLSASKNNGNDIVTNEQPKGQYIFSSEKIDVTAGYGYGAIHWNYPIELNKSYTGIASLRTATVTPRHPNDFNSSFTHAANLGIHWAITPYQTLSFQGLFQSDKVNHRTRYDVNVEDFSLSESRDYLEENRESSKIKNLEGAIYYQGMFESGWSVFAGLGYNRFQDNSNSGYIGFSYDVNSSYRNRKNYYRGELDVNYSFNDLLSLNFGYRGIWNRYSTLDRENWTVLSSYIDDHHNGYLFLDWSPSESILFHIGTGLETIHIANLNDAHNWLEVLPQISATWQPSNKFQLMAEYATKMEYPTIFQTSEGSVTIDRWLSMIGNSTISPSRNQMISLQGTLFESLILGAEYSRTGNLITEWYTSRNENEFIKIFINAKSQEFRLLAGYDWKIIEGLTWQNLIQWKWGKITGSGLSNQSSNLSLESKVNYWVKPIGLLASIEYSREMEKMPLLQGWQQYGQDLWQISLKKNILRNSLSFSLNYVPPIHLGVRTTQGAHIKTDFMDSNQRLNLRTYDNLLIFRIEWRFNKGRNKQRHIHQYEFETEQKQGKGLL